MIPSEVKTAQTVNTCKHFNKHMVPKPMIGKTICIRYQNHLVGKDGSVNDPPPGWIGRQDGGINRMTAALSSSHDGPALSSPCRCAALRCEELLRHTNGEAWTFWWRRGAGADGRAGGGNSHRSHGRRSNWWRRSERAADGSSRLWPEKNGRRRRGDGGRVAGDAAWRRRLERAWWWCRRPRLELEHGDGGGRGASGCSAWSWSAASRRQWRQRRKQRGWQRPPAG